MLATVAPRIDQAMGYRLSPRILYRRRLMWSADRRRTHAAALVLRDKLRSPNLDAHVGWFVAMS